MAIDSTSISGAAVAVDVNAAVTADVEAAVAAAAGLRLVGFCVREVAGTPAVATVRIIHGATVAGGTALAEIELAANVSDLKWLWPGIPCAGGLSIDHIAGEVNVELYTVTTG